MVEVWRDYFVNETIHALDILPINRVYKNNAYDNNFIN